MSETVFCALQNILSRLRSNNFEVDGYSNFVFFNENGIPRNAKSYRGALERIAKNMQKPMGFNCRQYRLISSDIHFVRIWQIRV